MDDVALVFLGRDVFGAGDTGVSLLYAGVGVGLLLGFALIVARATAFPAVMITIAGFVISSAGNLLTGLSPAPQHGTCRSDQDRPRLRSAVHG